MFISVHPLKLKGSVCSKGRKVKSSYFKLLTFFILPNSTCDKFHVYQSTLWKFQGCPSDRGNIAVAADVQLRSKIQYFLLPTGLVIISFVHHWLDSDFGFIWGNVSNFCEVLSLLLWFVTRSL